MLVSVRLAELGIILPEVAPAVGSYLPALVQGDTILVSGQLPLVAGVLHANGTVGEKPGNVSVQLAADCARIATLNALAAAAAVAGGVDRIERIARVVGYVASEPGFVHQPTVMNGASDLLVQLFGDAGRHVRSAVGVVSLPLGSPVEIEMTAVLG